MKNKWSAVFFILSLFFFSIDCNAQTPNNEQRLVGTWIREDNGSLNGTIWIFNSDGTGSWQGTSTRYGVAANKLIVLRQNSDYVYSYEYFISTDGKTLILLYTHQGTTEGMLFRKRT